MADKVWIATCNNSHRDRWIRRKSVQRKWESEISAKAKSKSEWLYMWLCMCDCVWIGMLRAFVLVQQHHMAAGQFIMKPTLNIFSTEVSPEGETPQYNEHTRMRIQVRHEKWEYERIRANGISAYLFILIKTSEEVTFHMPYLPCFVMIIRKQYPFWFMQIMLICWFCWVLDVMFELVMFGAVVRNFDELFDVALSFQQQLENKRTHKTSPKLWYRDAPKAHHQQT